MFPTREESAVRFEAVTKTFARPALPPPRESLGGRQLFDRLRRSVRTDRPQPGRQDDFGQDTALDLPADLGRIWRLGRSGKDRGTLARVGYVHESQAFPRYLTAHNLLEYYGALSRQPATVVRRRAAELLERFGLADRSREPIGRFSKGMVQRLSMAQALINDPELLVLDEPSEGMDLAARRLLYNVIRERREQGHTAVLVSHLLGDVERLCDRVAVLRCGKLGFLGTVGELEGDAPNDDPHDSAATFEEALEPYYAGVGN